MMKPMQIHEAELIMLMTSSLGAELPDSDELSQYGADSRSIDLKEAWAILREPPGSTGRSVVPTREGRLVLIRSEVISDDLLTLSRAWSERVVGVLATLYEADAVHLSE